MLSWTYLLGLLLGIAVVMPLGVKWQIDRRFTILAGPCLGILSAALVHVTHLYRQLGLLHVGLVEIALILLMAAALLLWRFYRDPRRIAPVGEDLIVAPADGKIIYVKRIDKQEVPLAEKKGRTFSIRDFVQSDLGIQEGYLVGIGMSFIDVHVNRAPVGGTVAVLKRIQGRFLSLKKREAILENERVFIVIDSGRFSVGVVQIASRLVRRIVPYIRQGQEIPKGERLGVIRFGSQVDLIIPDLPALSLKVRVGDSVKAGISVIAAYGTTGKSQEEARTGDCSRRKHD
jgi:phosphatidylserine decarboxylase